MFRYRAVRLFSSDNGYAAGDYDSAVFECDNWAELRWNELISWCSKSLYSRLLWSVFRAINIVL